MDEKLSKYVVIYKDSVLTLVDNKLHKLNSELINLLLDNKINKLNSEDIQSLLKSKILIDVNCDEKSEVLSTFRNKCNENKLYLTIMTTTECNFKCLYCYEEYEEVSYIGKEFIEKISRFVLKNINSYSGVYINWFGGEPLLCYNEIIILSKNIKKICNDNKKTFVSSITTNGYLLDGEKFRELTNENVFYYQITIDGMEEDHNYLRPCKDGKNSFKTIMNNLIDINNSTNKKSFYKIVIRSNICKSNQNSVVKFSDMFYKFFGNNKRFMLYVHNIEDWGGQRVKEVNNLLFANERSNVNKNIFEIKGIKCNCIRTNALVIDPSFNLYKCSHLVFKDKQKYSIGKIDSNDCIKLNSDSSTEISEKCLECKFLPYCLYNSCPFNLEIPKKNCKDDIRKKMITVCENYI